MNNLFAIFPVIRLENGILLRKINSDIDHLFYLDYMNNPKVRAYLSVDDIPKDPLSAKMELDYWGRLYDRQASFYWAIVIESSNQIIGTCGFNYWNKSQKRTEVSYDLDYNYWKQGITTQAIKALINFAFDKMEVQRIQATVAIDNIPSIRVLEKNGFKQEAFLEKYGVLEDKTKDFYMYAICS